MPNEKKPAVQEADPENYGMPANWSPVDAAPIVPGTPAGGTPPAPSGVNPFGSGALPSNLGLQPALVKTGYPPSTGPIDLFPIMGGAAANAKTIGVAKTVATQVVAAAIAAIPPAATPAATSDGLIHGETPWETDPAFFSQRDDFTSGTVVSGAIGELGWSLQSCGSGSGAPEPWYMGGGPAPIFGEFAMPNVGTSDVALLLTPNISNGGVPATGTIFQNLWPLLTSPNWKMVLTFRFSTILLPTTAFSMAKKAFYAGLYCTNGSTNTVRPPVFLGVRYDTDTTSPAISDTTLKFEAVANTLSGSRNNTQGQVFDTGMAPVLGQQFRLEIECLAVGVVTLTLANGSSVATTTFTIPTVTISSAGAAAETGNGQVSVINLGSNIAPWGPGSLVTFTGFPVGGEQTLFTSDNSGDFYFYSVYNASSGFVSGSATGYPAYTPGIMFGNDTEAAPTANAACLIDYYGFIWNPGVGGGTGTPNSNLPRYW